MELAELIAMQHEFDALHGWSVVGNDPQDTLVMLNKDLIGLFGEIGEFANLVKKLNLVLDSPLVEEFEQMFHQNKDSLEEEIVDVLIYLLRMSVHLDLDLESGYLRKLSTNKKRFSRYELPNPTE